MSHSLRQRLAALSLADAVALLRARLALLFNGHQGTNVRMYKRPFLRIKGRLILGDRVNFHAGPIGADLTVDEQAVLTIGSDSFVNYGVILNATKRIEIGKRCYFGYYATVMDCHMHGLAPEDRSIRPDAQPVVIEDDVWVATRAMIMPGVRIGRGSVIGAGSIVTKDVPPMSLVLGAPARVVGSVQKN
jgi:acetyltransferase-like isoleucine patch superfamily enzyme